MRLGSISPRRSRRQARKRPTTIRSILRMIRTCNSMTCRPDACCRTCMNAHAIIRAAFSRFAERVRSQCIRPDSPYKIIIHAPTPAKQSSEGPSLDKNPKMSVRATSKTNGPTAIAGAKRCRRVSRSTYCRKPSQHSRIASAGNAPASLVSLNMCNSKKRELAFIMKTFPSALPESGPLTARLDYRGLGGSK